MSRRLRLAAAACVVLCAAGCGSGGGSEPAGSLGEGAAETAADGEAPESTVAGTWESQEELENDRQRFIADCMTEQGFEYVPIVYPPAPTGPAVGLILYGEIRYDLELAVKLAREYGFGISLDADEWDEFIDAGSDDDLPPDPNDVIFEALSQSEKEAYSRAMSDDGGCWHMMEERFPIAVSYFDDDTLKAIEAIHEEFNERLAADPRIAEAEADLMGCLEEAGLPEGTLWASDYMKERFEQVTGFDYKEVEADLSELVDEDVLREFKAEERKVAEADARCQAEYLTVRNEVGFELEREVIESHPEILDMMADSP